MRIRKRYQESAIHPNALIDVQIIYQRYLQAFKKGVFNYIKEVPTIERTTIPRRYFSGGMSMAVDRAMVLVDNPLVMAKIASTLPGRSVIETVDIDAAMSAKSDVPDESGGFVTVTETNEARLVPGPRKARDYDGPDRNNFKAIDISHFIEVARRLKNRNLDVKTELVPVLDHLRVAHGEAINAVSIPGYYDAIYAAIAKKGMDAKLADKILNGRYTDPELWKTIFDQNRDPKGQGVMESISNALDAMGAFIGQFGWGVKQMLAWLGPNSTYELEFLSFDGNPQ